jgi:hypothetical protein
MKAKLAGILLAIFFTGGLFAQQRCASIEHQQAMVRLHPELLQTYQNINDFISRKTAERSRPGMPAKDESTIIKIPVIVHVLYHTQDENIPDENIYRQLDALNRDYRRLNADTANTPSCFSRVAADCKISFELAKVDPYGSATTGIERIYTPVEQWIVDDDMKFASKQGADAWDPRSYLNIWVCNMRDVLGYSSLPGDPLNIDGVVIRTDVFNNAGTSGRYQLGRTAVHEVGHWLGLIHIWGDQDCGDDKVDDTPKQATFTAGCPGGTRVSCNNGPTGDMYMNYMDYTDDGCMNLFTAGQKDRMRSLFIPGGPRYTILSSKALGTPDVAEIPLPEEGPQWLTPRLYPNPATSQVILDLRYDARWVGKEIILTNITGQVIRRIKITATVERINITNLKPGVYFLQGNKDGKKIVQKLLKTE